MKGSIYLTIAIITEIFATTMLKVSEGFTVLIPSVAVVVGYALSFYCLSLCLRTIPLSIAYAVWSGVGTVITAVISVIVWGEVFTDFKVLGIIFIIGGVVLLNTGKNTVTENDPSG
ncbi:QacE family quaternary ammonium compound efflux SMR transporter [Neobacillus notoginsengisoli]|uniref:QacE family quaternary ammonium compound efflux SMR transporter n=1 Tax=Neobacillus notoginsengisoli TaxID=1578198 RepID=A0A417YSI0_9BACI|nr:multidrug efflux SMR transporter [Neobacillus notoginsengisoli]RHW38943.1 QacE family quaternary ammonium compound efflux SMR transporter [Neobacillus notoginsengisoli]